MERDHRYWLLSALLLALAAFHVGEGVWIGDFWNHAAIARELSLRPLAPGHHLLAIATADNLYTPHHLAVGLATRWLPVGAVGALGAMAVLDLALLLAALRWFLGIVCRGSADAVAFYFLLFALLLWGFEPWDWSGFVHLGVFFWVLPYPSTFALALTFAALGLLAQTVERGGAVRAIALALVLAGVLLTHPPTAIACYAAACAMLVGLRPANQGSGGRATFAAGGAVALSLALAFAWPYYDVFDLLLFPAQGDEWHGTGRLFYEGVLGKTFPVLLGVPVVLLRLRRNPLDPLALTFAGLSCVYLYGGFGERQGLGRIISQIALCVQLALASAMAGLESRIPRAGRIGALVLAALLAAVTGNLDFRALERQVPVRAEQLAFVADRVGPDDVVLCTAEYSVILPAIAGKVVATNLPVYQLEDHRERRADVRRFFRAGTPRGERESIARRYAARFALVDRDRAIRRAGLLEELRSLGDVIAAGERFELIELRAGAP